MSFVLGFFVSSLTTDTQTQTFTETRRQGEYHFINPLLECDSNQFIPGQNLDSLKQELESKIANLINTKEIGFASVYYRDLNNGPWIGINQDELFSPASLIKVPIMITYYKMAEADPSILQRKLTFSNTQSNSIPIIPPSVSLIPNQEYTIDDLIYRMIAYSDNEAYELLNNDIDSNNIVATYNDLGIDISKGFTDPSGNIISVKSYASFFRILFNASYLSRSFSEKALSVLSHTEYKKALLAGIDPDIVIAHKFGERYYENGEKQLHDCGIVYLPKKPYLICIMTRGNNFDKLSDAIASLSNIVFKTVK